MHEQYVTNERSGKQKKKVVCELLSYIIVPLVVHRTRRGIHDAGG